MAERKAYQISITTFLADVQKLVPFIAVKKHKKIKFNKGSDRHLYIYLICENIFKKIITYK
jgi:hypothetical protein